MAQFSDRTRSPSPGLLLLPERRVPGTRVQARCAAGDGTSDPALRRLCAPLEGQRVAHLGHHGRSPVVSWGRDVSRAAVRADNTLDIIWRLRDHLNGHCSMRRVLGDRADEGPNCRRVARGPQAAVSQPRVPSMLPHGDSNRRVTRPATLAFGAAAHLPSSPAVWSKKATHLGRFSMSSRTLPCSYSMEK